MTKGQPIYVIADDLTGAADSANFFRTPAHRVRVSFNPDSPWMPSLGVNVVQVFDSESRSVDKEKAARRVAGAGKQLLASQSAAFHAYKKIDSTLRGHIGSEIEALLHGINRRIALLAPAFPANGRAVQDGKLFVNGMPISQTAFARDPRNPVVQDKVGDIVRQTTDLPVVELSRDIVMQGRGAITVFLRDIAHDEAIVVADAETDADLANIAQAIADDASVLPCGSAGLAKQLAALWVNATGESEISTTVSQAPSCNRVVIAVGSANPVSHEQLKQAASGFGSPVIEINPLELATRASHTQEIERANQALLDSTGFNVVGVSLAEKRAHRDPELPGSFEGDLAKVISDWSAGVIADRSNTVGFVATGGDTALALCEALSAAAIWPEGEVTAGIPWSWIETPHGNIPMISKAGGFGDPDALQKAASFLLNTETVVHNLNGDE